MRAYEILTETSWDLDGFWITETGKRLDINYDEEINHANIALDAFSNVDMSDSNVDLSDDDAENAVDDAMTAAYNNGWIRVVISQHEISVDFFKLNRISLGSLRKNITGYPVPKYTLSVNRDLDTSYSYDVFGSFKGLFKKLNQLKQGLTVRF